MNIKKFKKILLTLSVMSAPAIVAEVIDNNIAEANYRSGIIQENGKKYLYKNGIKQSDVLETINGKQYYFEPAGWGSNMAISKWSRSEKTNTWYYSDANGVVTKTQSDSPYAPQQKNGIVTENGKKYLYKNGIKQSDVLETINGKQYYFEPTGWGSNMAINKWSRSEKTNTWYYSDANGVVTKTQSSSPYSPQQKNGIVTENGKKYLYKNGVRQSDVLETINGKQYYFEPTGWGSNMAINKWSRSEKTNTWYYSDANGVVTKTQYSSPYEPQQKNGIVTENGKKYLYKNGVKQSDVLETINGKQYYFEPTGWGSNMAINKWSRSEKTNTWYYSDANGVVTKTQYSSPYNNNTSSSTTPTIKTFQYKNLKTTTNYTAEELNSIIRQMGGSSSKLLNKGATFKEAERRYGVNALYLLSHAALESNWGRSRIAIDKNNFFGIAAYDHSPYESATKFDDVDAGILGAAKWINNRYLIGTAFPARGAYLGDKSGGMNVYYATDPEWGYKIARIMYNINEKLGRRDR